VRRRYDRGGRVVAVDTASGEPVARVAYRYGDQVSRLELGGTLVAACAYDTEQRLASIEYRRIADGALVEGFRYRYDAAGLPVEAVRSTPLGESAERYRYDVAGRARLARYDVTDPADPSSPFGSETSYTPLPEGLWARRVDRDGAGAVLADQTSDVDERNRYRRFGDDELETDASGDIVRRTGPGGTCRYRYDGEHRLVRLECFDPAGRLRLIVIYAYDPLGRLVLRTVTDAAGVTTEAAYVWGGEVLLEEYENGPLARSYLHSVGSLPAQLKTTRPVRASHLYVHDGRGLASGLVQLGGANAFAEKYGYEVTGAPFLTEIAGVPVAFPDRHTTPSPLLNSVLSGRPGRCATGTPACWPGSAAACSTRGSPGSSTASPGSRGSPTAACGTRSPTSSAACSRCSVSAAAGSHPRSPARAASAAAACPSTQPPTRRCRAARSSRRRRSRPTRRSTSPAAALAPHRRAGRPSSRTSRTPTTRRSRLARRAAWRRPSAPWSAARSSPWAPRARTRRRQARPRLAAAARRRPRRTPRRPPRSRRRSRRRRRGPSARRGKRAQREAEERKKKEKEEEDKKKSNAEEGNKYPNPDPASSTIVTLPTAAQVEKKLNVAKHPVNPSEGGGQPTLDLSSPPPRQGGLDPTIAYFDADHPIGGWAGASEPTRLLAAPYDFVQGHETPQFGPPDPRSGGGIDPRAHRP
jgi:YD repeat-containing protein